MRGIVVVSPFPDGKIAGGEKKQNTGSQDSQIFQ
jgi:hypothetical protein